MLASMNARPVCRVLAVLSLPLAIAACGGSTHQPNRTAPASARAGVRVTVTCPASGQKPAAQCGKPVSLTAPAGFTSYHNNQKLAKDVTVHLPSGVMFVASANHCQIRLVAQSLISAAPVFYEHSGKAQHGVIFGSGRTGRSVWASEQVGTKPSPTYMYAYAQRLSARSYLQTIVAGQATAPLGPSSGACTAKRAIALLPQLKADAKRIASSPSAA